MTTTAPQQPQIYDPKAAALKPVTSTPAAAAHIQREIKKRGAGIGMRLQVKKSGCSGWMYALDIIDTSNDDDYKFPISDDLAVYVDPESYAFVKGTQLDFVQQGLNKVFVFNNPNASNACGCGESFTIKE